MRGPLPETCPDIRLLNWFSQYMIPCCHTRNCKIVNNKNVFNVKDTKKIARYDHKNGNIPIEGYIALKIKHATKSRNVAESLKIIAYLQQYRAKKAQYLLDDKLIKIKVFATSIFTNISKRVSLQTFVNRKVFKHHPFFLSYDVCFRYP